MAEVIAELLHKKVHPIHGTPSIKADAVSVVVPLQIVGFTGVMAAITWSWTVTVELAVLVHPYPVTETM